MSTEEHHQSHPDPNIAYHFDWEFRHEAAMWSDQKAIAPNFHPLATEFRQWLLREGKFSVFADNHKGATFSITNPYTYSASVIAAVLARSINASHEFAQSTVETDATEADIERIRLYNEQVLYVARFCEATIKQLLYCTQIPRKYYEDAALGALLASDCKSCRKAGKPSHKNSMLGSLAHRYGLCLAFDHCLIEHLKLVNRRRNLEAAHSDTQALNIRSAEESRLQLERDSLEVGNEFVHMLKHIGDLEIMMSNEIKSRIRSQGVSVFDATEIKADSSSDVSEYL